MSERQFRRNEWRDMCTGPDEQRAAQHEDRARFHAMMAKFYRLPKKDQRVFMATFEAMTDESEKN